MGRFLHSCQCYIAEPPSPRYFLNLCNYSALGQGHLFRLDQSLDHTYSLRLRFWQRTSIHFDPVATQRSPSLSSGSDSDRVLPKSSLVGRHQKNAFPHCSVHTYLNCVPLKLLRYALYLILSETQSTCRHRVKTSPLAPLRFSVQYLSHLTSIHYDHNRCTSFQALPSAYSNCRVWLAPGTLALRSTVQGRTQTGVVRIGESCGAWCPVRLKISPDTKV